MDNGHYGETGYHSLSAAVVSMPCCERFDQQDADYRESVLPQAVTSRVAIEAGVGSSWFRYVGLDGKVVSIERFGLSAPAPTVFQELGVTAEAVGALVEFMGEFADRNG